MYYDLLFKAFNMSVTASWLILAVLLLRLVFKKAPKWLRVALWGVVGLRLLLPFSLQSRVSLVPSVNTVSDPILRSAVNVAPTFVELDTGFAAIDGPYNEAVWRYAGQISGSDADFLQLMWTVLLYLWIAGIAAMLFWALVSFLKLRRQVRASVREEKNVYLCDEIRSPFILGVFRPRIYLPSHLSGRQKELILMHEQAHLKRLDHVWKPLGYLLLSVYWFNPVIWLAYILLCRDIELACDERVTKDLSDSERADYTQTLLDCAHKRRAVTACPVAFGEVGVKQRVKSVLNYKKPAFWIVLVAALLSVVCAVCFLTDPKTDRFYGKAPADGTLLNKAYPELVTEVNRALCEQSRNSYSGEFLTSQICVLGSDETEKEMNLYFFYQFDSFGFDNGFFTDVGGGSGATAAVFRINPDGTYQLSEIRETGMGSEYGKSLKRIFPSALARRALSGPTEKEAEEMWQGCVKSAQQYLRSIGRSGVELRQYRDVPHTLVTDLGVSVEVSNKLHNIAYVAEAGYVGVWESVEGGVRYVSENDFDREKNLLTFKKYQFDTGAVVFDLGLDASTGAVVYGATEPERQPESEGDGKVPTTYDDDGLIIPETAAEIPDASRQAAVTPFDLPGAENPDAETAPNGTVPYTTNTADGKTGNERDWTTAAFPANGRETTFSEATEEDLEALGTEFDADSFLNLLTPTLGLNTMITGYEEQHYDIDFDCTSDKTLLYIKMYLFYNSRSFICDSIFGEPETVEFTQSDDPFPELNNSLHRYVKYPKEYVDWAAVYILNTQPPDIEKIAWNNAAYKDGCYYFVDEIFGYECDKLARATNIKKQGNGTYLVKTEYRDVFTNKKLKGSGTLVVGLREMGGVRVWSVLSYEAKIYTGRIAF